MIKIGIVGGTGYTGVELLRLLAQHPQAEVVTITSRGDAGVPVADMYPSLRGRVSLKIRPRLIWRLATLCSLRLQTVLLCSRRQLCLMLVSGLLTLRPIFELRTSLSGKNGTA